MKMNGHTWEVVGLGQKLMRAYDEIVACVARNGQASPSELRLSLQYVVAEDHFQDVRPPYGKKDTLQVVEVVFSLARDVEAEIEFGWRKQDHRSVHVSKALELSLVITPILIHSYVQVEEDLFT